MVDARGEPNGVVRIIGKDGSLGEGVWMNGSWHGFARYIRPDGDLTIGYWE